MILTAVHACVYCAIALIVLTKTGNWACQILLDLIGLKDAVASTTDDPAPQATANVGRYIGALERLIIAAGLIAHSWEAIAAVVAIKTIGRFKELDKQLPAEYFLVGSLFSILWSIVIVLLWLLYDQHVGSNLSRTITALVGKAGG